MAKVRALMSGAGSAPVLESLYATENGNYTPSQGVDGFDEVTVAVPAPVITTKNIIANGTYNAVDDGAVGYSSVTVNVAGAQALIMNRLPLSSDGANGDTFIYYDNVINVLLATTVNGGYNGGASVKCYVDGANILNATGNSPYNLDYDIKTGTITKYGHTFTVTITPPANSTSTLVITWAIDNVTVWTESIMYTGSNTSYGYGDQAEDHTETIIGSENKIVGIYYKQNNVWITVGDDINIT